MASRLLRVFLDANVLFSAAYAPRGVPARVLASAVEHAFRPVLSDAVLSEVVRNIHSKSPAATPRLRDLLLATPLEVVPEGEHAEIERWLRAGLGSDARIFAAALAADVDVFCSGDRRLATRLREAALKSLRVLTPRQLLEELEAS